MCPSFKTNTLVSFSRIAKLYKPPHGVTIPESHVLTRILHRRQEEYVMARV